MNYTDLKKSGNSVGSSWGISSFFGRDGRENRTAARDTSVNKSYGEHAHAMDPALSIIQLKEVSLHNTHSILSPP